jgi:hypothetical protein
MLLFVGGVVPEGGLDRQETTQDVYLLLHMHPG